MIHNIDFNLNKKTIRDPIRGCSWYKIECAVERGT